MPTDHDLELFKAAYKTVKEIIRIKEIRGGKIDVYRF